MTIEGTFLGLLSLALLGALALAAWVWRRWSCCALFKNSVVGNWRRDNGMMRGAQAEVVMENPVRRTQIGVRNGGSGGVGADRSRSAVCSRSGHLDEPAEQEHVVAWRRAG